MKVSRLNLKNTENVKKGKAWVRLLKILLDESLTLVNLGGHLVRLLGITRTRCNLGSGHDQD